MKAEAPTQIWPHLEVIHLGASLAGKGLLGFAVELVLFVLRAGRNVQYSSAPEGREVWRSEQGVPPKALPMAKGCVIYPPPMSLAAQSGTQPLQSQVDLLSPALFPRPRHPAGWMSIPIECFTQLLLEVFSQSAPHSGHTGKSHQFAEARALLGCPPTPGTLRSAAASGKHSSCIACFKKRKMYLAETHYKTPVPWAPGDGGVSSHRSWAQTRAQSSPRLGSPASVPVPLSTWALLHLPSEGLSRAQSVSAEVTCHWLSSCTV